MSIKSDRWIKRMAAQGMIEPYSAEQVRTANGHKIVSYGTSSYGYDVRCAEEFKIFTNINSTIVDPKAFDEKSFVDFNGPVCIIPPNSFALARTVEFFRIPRSILTVCLGKSTYARCFRGDTRVALVDGTSPTLEQMARRHDGGENFWGYSIGENGRLIVTLLQAPRYIGRDSLLEISLDSGEKIYATPDHQFLRRDGRIASADKLRPNDALMPLYRDLSRGYEMIYQPIDGSVYPTHRLADEWNLRNEVYQDVSGTRRHHTDFDRRNNRPTNIQRLHAGDHIRVHTRENYRPGFDAGEHGAAIGAPFKRLAAGPGWQTDFNGSLSVRAGNIWNDSRYESIRTRLIHGRRSPSEAMREAHRRVAVRGLADPEQRARASRAVTQVGTNADSQRRAMQPDSARSVRLRSGVTEATSSFRGTPSYRNHKVRKVREIAGHHDVYCLTVPEAGNFALESGVFVKNCGIICNVTPLEPEWEGHVTLEFSNTTPLPAKIYANEGVAQMLFFESDEICETSYKDRGGKYQGQRGVTLPKA